MCAGVDHSGTATRLDINIDALPLAEIWAHAPSRDWKVLGQLAGGGVLTIDAAGAMAGTMQFAISDGLDAGAESGDTLAFDGALGFDGATALLDARIDLGEHGSFSARAAGIGQADGELTLSLAISDLSFVDGLSAEVQGMRGRLDGELRAPRNGRVLYRLAEAGEVLVAARHQHRPARRAEGRGVEAGHLRGSSMAASSTRQ